MLPKKKSSKARKRKRRSHLALTPVSLSPCPNCGESRLPHSACDNCGYVNQRVKLELAEAEES